MRLFFLTMLCMVLFFYSCEDSTGVRAELKIAANTGVTVAEGGSSQILSSNFTVSDGVNPDESMTIILVTPPTSGSLMMNGTALVANSRFNMSDIALGNVQYTHDGSGTTQDNIVLTVTNGIEAISAVIITFAVTPDGLPEALTIAPNFSGPLFKGNYYSGYLPATGFALWVEDAQGSFVKTLHVSKGMVEVGLYGAHTNHLPIWEAKSGVVIDTSVSDKSLAFIPEEFDGITSASPSFGTTLPDTTLSFSWDFTDANGAAVIPGTYTFHFEAGNIEKDSVESGTPPVTVFSETSAGTVVYGVNSSTVTAGTATTFIGSLTGTLVE